MNPSVSASIATCEIHRYHDPEPKVLHHHHILPLSWGGAEDGPEAILCPTSHYNVHALLNLYVHAGEAPPWSARQHFSFRERQLAAAAWEQRPSIHPPYTLEERPAKA